MKKRTHKALSWLLTAAMVLGMLPAMSLPAAAAEEIYVTHVDLLMDAPKAGMTADQYVDTIGIDNAHPASYNKLVVNRKEVYCYRIDDSSFALVGGTVSSFVEGGVYQCWVQVDLDDDGYAFAHDDDEMTVLVNGLALNNYNYDGLNGGAAEFDNQTYELTYTLYFTAEAADSGIAIKGTTPTQTHATWSYVQDTNTLTLNGYQGGGIDVSGMSTLNLVLKNNNSITVNGAGDVYGIGGSASSNVNLNISGSGTLVMNLTNTVASRSIYGIRGYQIAQTGGKISIKANSAAGSVYGVCGQSDVSITGGTLSVDATIQSASDCYGIYNVAGKILVDSGAEVNATIHNVGGGSAVHGIYNAASDATGSLANNGSITVNGTVSVTRAADSTGKVNGIVNSSIKYNTDGVISVGSGANVTLTDTLYGIDSYTRYNEGLASVSITGGTVTINSTVSGSFGIYSAYNGVSITGGTVNISTDGSALSLDTVNNTSGIIHIGGSAKVSLISDNSYPVYTGDSFSSTRVHTLDFTESTGSFTAKSNNSSFQYFPVQAFFQLGANTYLSEGSGGSSNDAGTGQIFGCDSTTGQVKAVYKISAGYPDLGTVKVNGWCFGMDQNNGSEPTWLYYKNNATNVYNGTDGNWNAHYDPTTGVLELKNYVGGPIVIGGANPTVVELKLTGANTIIADQANLDTGNYCAGVEIANADTVTVTGDGSLTVNVNAGDGIELAYGIYLYSTGNAQSDLTIQSGTVDLNVDYTGSTSSTTHAVGIYTGDTRNQSGKVTVGADAAVHASVISGLSGCQTKGIWAKGDVALNGETSFRLIYTGTGSLSNNWTSVTTDGSITIGDGASVSVDMPKGRSYGLSNAKLAADGNKTVSAEGSLYNNGVYQIFENENFRMVATDASGSFYADFDYMSKAKATAVTGITVTAANTALSAGGTTKVTAAVTPGDATYSGVLWSSGNSDVTVDASGTVTAAESITPGKALITAASKYDTTVTGAAVITLGTLDSATVYEVSARVPAPVVGEAPATAEEVEVDSGFSVTNITWYYRNDEFSDWESFSGTAFDADQYYKVAIRIKEESSNTYAAAANHMVAYINGKAAPVNYVNSYNCIADAVYVFGKAAAASSGGAIPSANAVTIDGGKAFADPGQLCFINGGSSTTASSSDYNAKYNPSTGVLELKNYVGGPIEIGGSVEADITIKLEGDNVITSSGQFGIVNHHGGDITITADSDATLTINVTSDTTEAIGIACDRTESYPGCSRAITIGGKAQVTVNATCSDTGDIKTAAGLRTPGTVTIQDSASFKAVCKSATPSIGVQAGVGILGYKGVTINTTGTVDIDVSQCESLGTFAIYGSADNELKKAGSMTLKWKQNGVNGGMLYPVGSFDSAAATHAVNVDTANRVATYRYGTPYTVTVNNGSCDAVGRQYLAGDTVTVTAGTIEGLEFTKWTSKDVTIEDATSTTASFTMPAQDVNVVADFGAFAVPPVFTLTDEGTGTISFTLAKLPSDAPKLVEKDSDTVVGNQYFYGSELSRSNQVSDGTGTFDVPAGEYRIAVQYSDTWLYSDVFTVSYAGTPQATVKDQTVSGTRGAALMNPVEVTISLKFDTFQNVAVGDDVKSWFTNLPSGLTAVINSVNSDRNSVYITISGTPTQVKNEAMAITIPAGKLTISETDLTVTANDNARFEIAQSPYALTDLSADLNLEPLMSYDSITTTVPEEDRDKYDIIVLGAKLYGSELGTAEVADPGEQLTLTVGVAAKAPYLLTTADLDSLKVQVGGHGAGPVIYYSGGGYAYKSVTVNGLDYWEFSVSETFTVPAYTFSKIDFALDPVEEGENPDMTADVTGSEALPFSKLVPSVEWTDLGTDRNDNTAITAGSKFQAGHYYECRVKFTLSDANYLFPGVGGMTITANGKTISETTTDPNTNRLVSCFAYEYDLGSGSWCYTVYLRGKLAEEGKVDLTGVSRDGGTISYTILPSGEETSVHVLVAQYQDGKVVDVKLTTLVITGSDAIAGTIEGFTPTAGCTYKVFLLEDGKYIPLCLAVDLS